MLTDIQAELPTSIELVPVPGSEVPPFDTAVDRPDGGDPLKIAPPLDKAGRGTYVSIVNAPKASKKSVESRAHHWKHKGITAIVSVRVSYAQNAAQEWRQSAPDAAEHEDAMHTGLACYDELSVAKRCEAEEFGIVGGAPPARVWCYLTHTKAQLASLFQTGHGVCLVSPRSVPSFLQALKSMGSGATLENLYVEEVMALAQMWNTKVLNDSAVLEALKELACTRTRRVFGFDADYRLDEHVWKLPEGEGRPATLMAYLVPDRPHKIFCIAETRPHLELKVALFHGNVQEEAVLFEALKRRLRACMLRHGTDFRVWHTFSSSRACMDNYATATEHGIRSMPVVGGDCDDELKMRRLTDFDHEGSDKVYFLSTSAVTVGVNPGLEGWGACLAEVGPLASGPIAHAQSAGRPGRKVPSQQLVARRTPSTSTASSDAPQSAVVSRGLELDTILWLMPNTSPPKAHDELTPLGVAKKSLETKLTHKAAYAQRSKFRFQTTPKPLQYIAMLNEKEQLDTRFHLSLYTQRVLKHQVGWTLIPFDAIELPPRVAMLADGDVESILASKLPPLLSEVEKLEVLPMKMKMQLGHGMLVRAVQEAAQKDGVEYRDAEKDVLATCAGMVAHSHVTDTFTTSCARSANDKFMLRAWRAARHFDSLSAHSVPELEVVQDHADSLNLAACHLALGARRLALARGLLASKPGGPEVTMYTRLPERVDALEQACALIGVSTLATQRTVLTVDDSNFVRLLQFDKMGVPSVEVDDAIKRLRVLLSIVDTSATGGSRAKTLWGVFSALLTCICCEAKVVKERRMNEAEAKEWQACNNAEGGFLMAHAGMPLANAEVDALLEDMDTEGGPPEALQHQNHEDPAVAAGAETADDASSEKKPARKRAKRCVEGERLRLPVQIELGRRLFYFRSDDGTPLDAKKAHNVVDGVYTASRAAAGSTEKETFAVRVCDFVPEWLVFSHEHGTSLPVRAMLSRQAPLDVVERVIDALKAPADTAHGSHRAFMTTLDATQRHAAIATIDAAPVTADGSKPFMVALTDGTVHARIPIPDAAFASALKRLRGRKERANNKCCSPDALAAYQKVASGYSASKTERVRLEREHALKVSDALGPKDTAALQWLEAVDKHATPADADGFRWHVEVYAKPKGFGRLTASYPSLQCAEGGILKEIMCTIADDWDIVSCHFFLAEAALRGLLKLPEAEIQATIDVVLRYNAACTEDVCTGRGKEHNTFLKPIAEWYGVSIGEAKLGCHIVFNQGLIETWLTKELEPPRDAPDAGHHPDLLELQFAARRLRTLWTQHAARLFPTDAFNGLRARLEADHPPDTPQLQEKLEKSIFSYCMFHFEAKALSICADVATQHGLFPLSYKYDGMLTLHDEGVDKVTFRAEAEASLLAYFKTPLHLIEKPFFEA